LDFLCFERRVDPGGGWFSGRAWRHSDEAFWVGLEGAIEGFLAGVINLFGLAVMDLIGRHQTDAGVVMVAIVPVEKVTTERLCVLEAAEAFWELRLASRGELSPSALSDPSVRLSPHSAPIK
jgi:hypothetical protein